MVPQIPFNQDTWPGCKGVDTCCQSRGNTGNWKWPHSPGDKWLEHVLGVQVPSHVFLLAASRMRHKLSISHIVMIKYTLPPKFSINVRMLLWCVVIPESFWDLFLKEALWFVRLAGFGSCHPVALFSSKLSSPARFPKTAWPAMKMQRVNSK